MYITEKCCTQVANYRQLHEGLTLSNHSATWFYKPDEYLEALDYCTLTPAMVDKKTTPILISLNILCSILMSAACQLQGFSFHRKPASLGHGIALLSLIHLIKDLSPYGNITTAP